MTEKEQILLELYVADEIFEKQEQLNAQLAKIEAKEDKDFTFSFNGQKLSADSEGEIVFKMGEACKEFYGQGGPTRVEPIVYKPSYIKKKKKIDDVTVPIAFVIGLLSWVGFTIRFILKHKQDTMFGPILYGIILGFLVGFGMCLASVFILSLFVPVAKEKDYFGDLELAKEYLNAYRKYKEKENTENYNKLVSTAYFYVVMTYYKADYERFVAAHQEHLKECNQKYEMRKKQISNVKQKINEVVVYHGDLCSKLEVLPPAYIQDRQTVTKLLTLVLNKRADTVKELINLYETEKWREKVVDRLDRQYQLTYEATKATLRALSQINSSIGMIHASVLKIKPVTNVKVDNKTVVDVKVNN